MNSSRRARYGLGGAKEKEKYFEGNDIPESRG